MTAINTATTATSTSTDSNSNPSLLGPVSPASWRAQSIGDGLGRPLMVLLTPDAANSDSSSKIYNTFYYLPYVPRLARNAGNAPALSLTLLLSRQPTSAEETIHPLITQGFLNITPTLELPIEMPGEAQSRGSTRQASYKPLFVRQVTFTIETRPANGLDATIRLVASSTAGAGFSAPVTAALSREDTLRILAALEGQDSNLNIRARLAYRGYEPNTSRSTILTAEVTSKLEDTLGGVLDDQPREAFIHLVALGSGEPNGTKQSGQSLRINGSAMQNVPRRVVVPSSNADVGLLTTRMRIDGRIREIDDLLDVDKFHRPRPQLHSLPVIDSLTSPVWRDRLNPNKYWYAPVFSLVEPARATRPEDSSFLFTVARSGATDAGQPGLDAFIKLTLQSSMGDAAREALSGLAGAEIQPVPLDQIAFTFELPFRDEAGVTRTQQLNATIVRVEQGIYTLQVALLNEWARLGYGALAVRNFQSQAARLVVSYTYKGYAGATRTITRNKIPSSPANTAGGKSMLLLSSRQHDRLGNGSAGGESEGSVAQVSQAIPAPPISTPKPIVPADDLEPEGPILIRAYRYEQRLETLFSCDLFGAFYRQDHQGSTTAIGCQDALALGKAAFHQYNEAEEFRHRLYRVYRSLQQPGTFLVLPATYLITRRGADSDTKSYRPSILVYSTSDAQVSANNRVIFQMQLEPAIPPDTRRRLLEALASEAPAPIVEYPTNIAGDISYSWSVGDDLSIVPRTATYPGGFQVTLSTDITGALLISSMLKMSGIMGSAAFKLSDGTQLITSLELDLSALTGPWISGPVEIARAGSGLQLTNRIESPVNVSDLLVYEGDPHGILLPVETLLAPGQSCVVEVDPGKVSEAYAVSAAAGNAPVSLDEVRAFVEDMQLTVIFVDLVNHPAHNLARNDIFVKLADLTEPSKVEMANPNGGPPIGQVAWVLPLTTYLEKHEIYFQVSKVPLDGSQAIEGPWRRWDIQAKGNVISLTWELIQ